ncbi:MAG: hypothetical protein QOG57_2643, partial [Pseudonocardiales bacterium]|nr:hypothetical protein [Pseudonocardiales bacterium]
MRYGAASTWMRSGLAGRGMGPEERTQPPSAPGAQMTRSRFDRQGVAGQIHR